MAGRLSEGALVTRFYNKSHDPSDIPKKGRGNESHSKSGNDDTYHFFLHRRLGGFNQNRDDVVLSITN